MSDIGTGGLALREKLIFEHSRPGRSGCRLPQLDVPAAHLPPDLERDGIDGFPEVSEVEVVRHFTRLSSWNYGVDSGFYPLGSCTMKYNPKVNEAAARIRGLALLHPYTPVELCQGALALIHHLEELLGEISGFPAVSLHPAAGAHGELAGMMVIRACHEKRGNPRRKVLIPDTAHGTNPASATLCGYEVTPLESDGFLSAATVAAAMDEETAAVMITNPNTLGLFEKEIGAICAAVHAKGGLVYCDGANLNALLGLSRPGDAGIDVMHFNLHKTFSTPHGGGGPGAGPIGVTKELEPFLPLPRIVREGERYLFDYDRPDSIGRLRAFYGNFAILVRAYTYIRMLGAAGLRQAAEMAVLNANYIRSGLEGHYHLPHPQRSLHEVVFSDQHLEGDCHTIDVAKRLIDLGFHPPTVYFPLVVKGALMVEPTETETRESLDEFCEAMVRIAEEAKTSPGLLKEAPRRTIVRRLDEVLAARKPRLRWRRENS
ncbi:MAG: aminomethyl-transferring glycine dehydrogenase subunit GcvPB [Desulfuromonadaceae bacterium]|nr:aminomethyl-transferring glycine dehydrogenase subunit GcvPB [Desulfuromonadaceae bacterium]